MTTDPRVIEGAKAMLVWDKSDPEGECLGDLISEPEQIATLARACILKWLEQMNPQGWIIQMPEGKAIMASRRDAYVAACRTSACAERGFDEKDCGNCAYCADLGDNVIAAYCAQAAKEIAQ